jgi:hypothetical protein
MFNTEIGVNTSEYISILESGVLLHFRLGDETSCNDCHGTLDKFSTTLLAKLPLYPWHLSHLSIPLMTRTELFFEGLDGALLSSPARKTRTMRAARSLVTVGAAQDTNNQALEYLFSHSSLQMF